ncbi:MAG: hypothetical protein JNM88_04430 [Chitinophagaceae bacterium]|nr:hypothetical protein [Chitinophagaceae bacterium]
MNHSLYYRLITLWVLTEALLGGIIHGLRLPVSGLIVGSCAVAIISLIGWYVPQRGAILRATIVVAIFKMMLSPQAPPMAYVAVFFQGLLGELLFANRKQFRVNCMLLAIIALLESALQRILVLTIVYGNDLWTAFNTFISTLTRQQDNINYSFLIAAVYVVLHLIAAILIGRYISRLPLRVSQWQRSGTMQLNEDNEPQPTPVPKKKKTKWLLLLLIWLLFLALYIQTYYKIGRPLLPAHVSLKILLRSVIIILGWVLLLGPLVKWLLHRWLQRQKGKLQQEVQAVVTLLPATQQLAAAAWKQTAGQSALRRIKTWAQTMLTHTLATNNIIILTAPIQSGKTTSLIVFAKTQPDLHGILTPVVEGKRMFMNIATGEYFPMEATAGEKETISVGRFTFSKNGFHKATEIIRSAAQKNNWIVIDEIGPLELRGEGFHDILNEIITQGKNQLLLVVREGLASQVQQHFGFTATIINSINQFNHQQTAT